MPDLITLILAISPAVIASIIQFSTIAVIIRRFSTIIETFRLFRENNATEIREIRDQFAIVMQENYELKRQINELLESQTRIRRR